MKKQLSTAFALSLLLFACSKDKEETPTPPTGGGSGSSAPDAILTAHWNEYSNDNAFAVFLANDTPVDVGSVTLNNGAPDIVSPGAYGWYLSPLDVSTNVSWVVAGGNGFTGFTREVNFIILPQVDTITSSTEVQKSAGYTLSCTGVSDADSVEFTIGYIPSKTIAGNASSCVFTPEELAAIPNGPSQCTVRVLSYALETIGGKRIQFQRSSVAFVNVTVSD